MVLGPSISCTLYLPMRTRFLVEEGKQMADEPLTSMRWWHETWRGQVWSRTEIKTSMLVRDACNQLSIPKDTLHIFPHWFL